MIAKKARRVIQHNQQCGMLAKGYEENVYVYVSLHMGLGDRTGGKQAPSC